MTHNQPSLGVRMRPATFSLLLGFAISLTLAVPTLVFGRHGIWQMIYWNIGLPFDVLLGLTILRHDVVESLPKVCMPVIGILGGFVTWGIFFSIMMYGCLCKRQLASGETASNQPKSDQYRIIAIVILLLGAGFTAAGCVLNAYQASSGCGPDYPRPFELVKVIGSGAALGIPIGLTAAFYWLFRSGKSGNIVTLSLAVIYAAVSGYTAISNAITGYAPCDRKGDEYSAALFLFGLLILWLWMFLYSISVLESVPKGAKNLPRTPSVGSHN